MSLSLSWLTTLFFITIRLGTLLLFIPIQAIRQLPIHARLIFIFSLSMLLVHFVPLNREFNNSQILLGSLSEFANGLILTTSLHATFSIFQIAGQIMDNEIGLNATAIFNPSGHQESITSHLLSMLAVLFFFSLDGEVWLFKALIYSFIIIPPGTLNLFPGFTPVIKQFGFMFVTSFMIASPIVLALLAIDLCGALITRNMPQINTYFFTLPLKILIGFMLLALLVDYLNPLMNKVLSQCFQTWDEMMS